MYRTPVEAGLPGVVVVVQVVVPLAEAIPPPRSIAVAFESQFVLDCALVPGT